MKVAIVGSRDFSNTELIINTIQSFPKDWIVISGGARGVDTIAENTAIACGLKTMIFPANWKGHGKAAGPIRNELIVREADMFIIFWDGRSKGTANTLALAQKANKPIYLILG